MTWFPELPIGELRPWPDGVKVVRDGTPQESRMYVVEDTCRDLSGFSDYFLCSRCGLELDVSDIHDEPIMWRDGLAESPRFCPWCGARIEVE